MQSENRFLNFAEQIIASHRGFGYGYEPAAMLYLEDTMQEGQEQIPPSQSFVTKLYQIQNIKEENYLYRQNLSFLTQILEKRLYQNLYPSVETQIEKVVREEMPNVGTEVVKSFSQHLCRLVEQGGIEQFERIRDRILSEYQTNEKTTWKEQEILFRKIENIWNSSVYSRTDNHLENNTYRNAVSVDQTWEEQNQTILERTMAVMQRQEQLLMAAKPQGIGNLGRTYESVVMTANPGHTYEPVVMTANPPAVLEYAAESRFTETEQEILERQFQEKQLLEQQLLQETKLTESLTEQLTERIREKESQKTHNRTTERLERETNVQSTEHILTPEIRDVTQNVIQNITPVHQDYLNLEYRTEESSQIYEESSQNHEKIVQVLQTESERTLEREHEEQIHEKVLQQQTQLVSQISEHIFTLEMRNETQNVSPVYQDYLNLEYPTEESSQIHEEIVQMLQTEPERTLEREHEEQIHEKVLQQQTQLVSQISEHIITPETLLSMSQNDSQSNIQSLSQELVQNVVQDLTRNETQNFSPVHQDYLNLEYSTEESSQNHGESSQLREESSQNHQEIVQMLQTEPGQISERELEEQVYEKILQQQTQLVSQISEHILTPETLMQKSNIQSLSQELVQNVTQNVAQNVAQNVIQDFSSVHQDYLNLEYPTEESSQIHQEIMQILQTELERIPEVPQAAASETVSQQQVLLARKSKNLAEQMILRMETSGIVPKAQTVSAAKTVALQQLSQAILEYADSHTTTEELTSSVVHILKGYQNESVRELPTESYYSESIRRLPSESSVVRKLIKQQLQITEPVQNLETASIVYRSEEASAKSQDRTIQLEKQINEVVKNLKTVEEKTIVHKEKIIEEQKNVVHEVLRSNPQVWTEGEGANFIRKEVRQSMDEQLTQNVNQIVSKVYRRLEDKLRTERGRRGLI